MRAIFSRSSGTLCTVGETTLAGWLGVARQKVATVETTVLQAPTRRLILLVSLAFTMLAVALAPSVNATDGSDTEEWTAQHSGTTENLNAVSFVDPLYGHAVGNKGTLLATEDGGQTWSPQFICRLPCPAPFQVDVVGGFNDVSFFDRNHGHVVGNRGRILVTTDGGFTWLPQESPTIQALLGVSFLDAERGYAVGDGGTILATTDGGSTWVAQASGTTRVLRGVSFVDPDHGYAVGDSGTVVATKDGGDTWHAQSTGTTELFFGVSFVDTDHGHVVGLNGTILATSDAGTTWIRQDSGTTRALLGVSFTDADHGHAVGTFGTILSTQDGGSTWIREMSGTTRHLADVSFVDAHNGHAIGEDGTILATGGVRRERIVPPRGRPACAGSGDDVALPGSQRGCSDSMGA